MDELELILTDIFKCSRSDLYLNSNSITFHDREFKVLYDETFQVNEETSSPD